MLSHDQSHLLVRLLAMCDGIFRPLRAADWRRSELPPVLFEYRRDWLTTGVPWQVNDPSDSSRRGEQRILDALAVDGLVEIKRSPGIRWPLCRLSDRGDWTARALTGLPWADAGWESLRRVVELADAESGLCAETWLAGCDYDFPNAAYELAIVWFCAAPAVARGWLGHRSDVEGRVYFFATPAGCDVATGPEPEPPHDLPELDRTWGELYHDSTNRFRDRLRAARANDRGEMGSIPVSCSLDLTPGGPVRMRSAKAHKTTKAKAKRKTTRRTKSH